MPMILTGARIEVACPSAVCSRSSELRLLELHRSCGEGDLDRVETTWVQVEGEPLVQETHTIHVT